MSPVRAIVVLPTYNEADNVGPYVAALRAATACVSASVELLVVDDSSPDGTADRFRTLADDDGIHVMVRSNKDGLGAAYRAGFAHVLADEPGYDVVISMDADLSHDPAVIPEMLGHIADGADAVVGSRYVDGGGTLNWPFYRRLLSRWGNAYTRTILRLGVRDCTSGFRAYRSGALAAIEPQSTTADGYAFLTELVRRLDRAGFRVDETPIVFADRTHGKSKMSLRIILESMWRVTRWGLSRER